MLQRATHFPRHQLPPRPTSPTVGHRLPLGRPRHGPSMGRKPTKKRKNCARRGLALCRLPRNKLDLHLDLCWEQPQVNGEAAFIPRATTCGCSAKWWVQSILIILICFLLLLLFFYFIWLVSGTIRTAKSWMNIFELFWSSKRHFREAYFPMEKK